MSTATDVTTNVLRAMLLLAAMASAGGCWRGMLGVRSAARVEPAREGLQLGLEAVARLLQLGLDLERAGRARARRRPQLREAEQACTRAGQQERGRDDQTRSPGRKDDRQRDAGRHEQSGSAEEHQDRGGEQDGDADPGLSERLRKAGLDELDLDPDEPQAVGDETPDELGERRRGTPSVTAEAEQGQCRPSANSSTKATRLPCRGLSAMS